MSQTARLAGDGAAGDTPARDTQADRPADPPPTGRRGSLASVLQTLRDAASVHDGQEQSPRLPAIGPLPAQRKGKERP